MENLYKNISYFFIMIFVIIVAGFYKTYFGLFPTFEKVTIAQHIHSVLFLIWFIMLIIQPVLIRKGKYELHRTIGKFSYILVPMLIITIFYISKGFYEKEIALNTDERVNAMLFVPFYQIFDFTLLYLMAIYYKKTTPFHMRYIIGCSLAISGAALRRICTKLIGLNSSDAFAIGFALTDLCLILLIIFDLKNNKNPKPYLVSLAVVGLSQMAFYYVPETQIWQKWCGWFVHSFFN